MKKVLCLLMAALMCCGMIAMASAETINVAYMPNYASLWSVVTGIEGGFFAEEGLEVKLVEFADGPTIIAAMENGSIDLGYIGPGAHRLCIQGRAKIFTMSHIGNADAVIGLASKGIQTAEDLKGKKVGYASGTSSETILVYTLQSVGLTMDDIEAYEMDASALVTAMLSGSLDACAAWSPSTATMEAELGDDYVVLGTNLDFADKAASVASWIVMDKYYQENADLVLRFTRALYKAMDYQREHLEETCEWVAKQVAADYETVYAQRGDGAWLTTAEFKELLDTGVIAGYYQVQQQGFLDSGAVEAAVPIEEYVLFENMENATK